MNDLAPIIFICYNRYHHVVKSLSSLKKNKLAKKSKIIIFSDGAKDGINKDKIRKVREYLKKLSGFKSKKIIFRRENFGTKKNIVSAINEVLKTFNKFIVIEDDLILSKFFLDYMNLCLKNYKYEKKIWHVNGWSYPFMKNSKNDINFLGSMNCWGWGTWKNRWSNLTLNEKYLISNFSKKNIHNFNIFSSMNHFEQIIRNKNKTLSSWAVFWHATIFKNNGICIYPKYSLVKNIGFDGSGRMSSRHKYMSNLNNNYKNFKVNSEIYKSKKLMNAEFNYYIMRKSIIGRLLVYLKKIYFSIF